MLKSIWAVVAGFLAVVVLSVVTDTLLEKFGVFPPVTNPGAYVTWMLALALVYRSLYTILGGYVTAALAPMNPMKHIYVSMVLGAIGGVGGAVAGWHLGNHWYPVALAVSGPVFVWVGGKLKK
ncbi:MAG: hypothetical protein M1333_02675 [Patescibacteria group bacterium]|nr:hypothetical protein [Patescibacteria group bacterium]